MLVEKDVEAAVAEARRLLGTDPAEWPGGWPNEIEAALIDAVLSARAKATAQRRSGSHRPISGVWQAVEASTTRPIGRAQSGQTHDSPATDSEQPAGSRRNSSLKPPPDSSALECTMRQI